MGMWDARCNDRSGARRRGRAAGRILIPPALFLLCLSFLPLASLSARTIVVCPGCLIKTPEEGIRQAGAGDEVRVRYGVYRVKTLVVDRPVRLVGEGYPVLDGGGVGHVVDLKSDNISLRGFIIKNSGTSDIAEFAGIHGEEISHCHIEGNHLINNTYGFYFARMKGCVIRRNTTLSSARSEVIGGNGLHMWYSTGSLVEENYFIGHRDGIYLEFSGNLLIRNNVSIKNIRYGMHFMFSHDNQFIGNTFRDNETGVAVMYSRGIRVERNRFEESRGVSSYGILLKDINDSFFRENLFRDNTYGVYADNAMRNEFYRNRFLRNGISIRLPGNCEENRFRENDIISGFFEVTTNTRSSRNSFDKNYWSSYKGYDLDRDGYGDVPHHPVTIFSFWVSRYPVLGILFLSPVVEFLEIAERALPVLTPAELRDEHPALRPRQGGIP